MNSIAVNKAGTTRKLIDLTTEVCHRLSYDLVEKIAAGLNPIRKSLKI